LKKYCRMSEKIPSSLPVRPEEANGNATTPIILLIDDDHDMHDLCRHYMIAAGYHLLSAFNGASGMDFLRTRHVDLVLLDCMLPDSDGYTLFQQILTTPALAARDLPVIMLTVIRENLTRRQELLDQGLTMYLEKPFGAPELIKVIDNVLATHARHALEHESLAVKEENHRTPPNLPLREARQKWLHQFERQYLIDLLKTYNGNISRVARRAGVHRMTIYRMLKHYDIAIASRRSEV
jgi:DNA-binding NtrC family response regulator